MDNNEAKVKRYWGEMWSDGQMGYAREFYAATYHENSDASTPDEFIEGATTWRNHFEAFDCTIDDLFSAGQDRVVSRVTYRGRHTGDFSFLPAQGREYAVGGIDIFEFRDGFVVQHWHSTDHLEFFEQLGATLVPET